MSTVAAERLHAVEDPALRQQIQDLRRTNNFTNLFYQTRTWLLLAAVMGGAPRAGDCGGQRAGVERSGVESGNSCRKRKRVGENQPKTGGQLSAAGASG
jgi:hypothetical protein